MIIKALMELIYNLFAILTAPIAIPAMGVEVISTITDGGEYIKMGLGLLANWTDLTYLLSLYAIVIAVDMGLLLYNLVMWVLAKIPMLGIE